MTNWRYYLMGISHTVQKEFLAPNISVAFSAARSRWPSAESIHCYGSHVSPQIIYSTWKDRDSGYRG